MGHVLLRWSAVSSIAILLASSSTAVAQDPSVQVDSDSPAGTEYGLPVDQARRTGAAPSAPTPGDDAPGIAGAAGARGTLFGEGIAQEKTASDPGGPAREQASGSTSSGSTAGGERAFAPTAQPSGSALPWLLGSALLVLVIGAGLSRALRRVARPSQ